MLEFLADRQTDRPNAMARRWQNACAGLVLAVEITSSMVCDFNTGDYIPVLDQPPDDDENTIATESDFDIQALAAELRAWRRRGRSEEAFRELLRARWSTYADVEFPGRKSWLLREEAEVLVALGVAEPVAVGGIEDALEAWGL